MAQKYEAVAELPKRLAIKPKPQAQVLSTDNPACPPLLPVAHGSRQWMQIVKPFVVPLTANEPSSAAEFTQQLHKFSLQCR